MIRWHVLFEKNGKYRHLFFDAWDSLDAEEHAESVQDYGETILFLLDEASMDKDLKFELENKND